MPTQSDGGAARHNVHALRNPSAVDAPLGSRVRKVEPSEASKLAALRVEANRPPSLRQWDQIPMRASDLARQAELVAPTLAGKRVVFMGDHDGMSLVLGLLGSSDTGYMPAKVVLLDFDERLLAAATAFAERSGFGHVLDVHPYNVFDPVPGLLKGSFDAFYTNPPYGSQNRGESVRLFLTRCLELMRTGRDSLGYAILPDDQSRSWTRSAMRETEAFMNAHGWYIAEKGRAMHGYHLDDDPELRSATVLFESVAFTRALADSLRFGGRRVHPHEIPGFYGASERPPYPRYLRPDGAIEEWPAA